MNMMPLGMGMSQSQMAPPQMPSPDQIEQAKLIAEACSWEEISAILRSDDRRNYSIDIETDATVFEDQEAEKQSRIEFITALTAMLEKAVPLMSMNPTYTPLIKEMTVFAAGAFKPGRNFEEIIADTFDQVKNTPPQPNPDQQKMEMEAKAKQAEAAARQQEMQQEMAFKQQEHQLKIAGHQADLEFKERELQMKAAQAAQDRQSQMEQTMWDREMAKSEREFKVSSQQQDFAFKRDEAMADRAAADEDRQFQREVTIQDAGAKHQERQLKARDMEARLTMDQDEQKARRALEGDQIKGEGGKTARQEIETGVATQIGQVADAISALQEGQIRTAEAIQSLFTKQEQTQDALLAAIKRLGAPRNIKRDPKTGRALGVEILEDAA